MRIIRKVGKTAKKKKQVLTIEILNNPDEIHQYVELVKFARQPACMMCKYQWYAKVFVKKMVGACNREIKAQTMDLHTVMLLFVKNIFTFLHNNNNSN